MPPSDRSDSTPPVPYEVSPHVRHAIAGLADAATDTRPRIGVLSDASAMRGYISRCLRSQFEVTAAADTLPSLVHLARGHGLHLIVADLLTLTHETDRLHLLAETFAGVPLLVLSQVQGYSTPLFKEEAVQPAAVVTLPAQASEIRATARAVLRSPDPDS